MPAARARSRTVEPRVKPRSDAYVGLLGIALVALTAAMVFAYLNWDQLKEDPKPLPAAPAAGGARTAPTGTPAAVPAGQGAPGAVPPPGGQGNAPPPQGAPGGNPAPPPPQPPPQAK